MQSVAEIAAKLGIPADALHLYGHTKAKIDSDYVQTLPTHDANWSSSPQ